MHFISDRLDTPILCIRLHNAELDQACPQTAAQPILGSMTARLHLNTSSEEDVIQVERSVRTTLDTKISNLSLK